MSQLKKHLDKKGNSFPHLYIDQVTGEFWAVIRVRKKIRKRNLKTKSYIEAIGSIPQVLAELGNEKAQEKRAKKGPQKLLSGYWEDLKREKIADETSAATMKRMDTVWRHHLEPYLGNWAPKHVTPDMIPDFVIWHRKKKPGRQLVNVYKYMGNLFNYMVRTGALQQSQVPLINIPKSEKKHHDKKKGRIITDAENKAMHKNAKGRIRCVIALADPLGSRKMEIVSLEKSRIKTEDGRMFLVLDTDNTKTGLARVLPVPKRSEKILKKQIEESGDSPYLFPTKDGTKHIPAPLIDRDWKVLKKKAEIKGRLRFHDWRHTRATKFAQQKVNPIIACTILGMNISVYQKVYAQLSGKDLIETIDSID